MSIIGTLILFESVWPLVELRFPFLLGVTGALAKLLLGISMTTSVAILQIVLDALLYGFPNAGHEVTRTVP